MIGQDELKKQQEYQELDLLKKFYDFACQCKSKENKDDKHEVEFDCGSSGKLKFNYDLNCGNLIPNNINNIDLTSQPIFCCIGGFFVMFSQGKDGKTNVYALNDDCTNKQDIKPYVFNIKNVPIGNAKKFLSSFVDNTEPEEVNDYAKQVKNELDFKCVFSEITENDNKQDIEQIVKQNQIRMTVMRIFKNSFNESRWLAKIANRKIICCTIVPNCSFIGFDGKTVNIDYDIKTGDIAMAGSGEKIDLSKKDYYFGKQSLLMAFTKGNNDKVNIYAMNADSSKNLFGDYNDVFAVYNVTKKEAETFIENLNKYPMDKAYYNITQKEQFEEFFKQHCKNNDMYFDVQGAENGESHWSLCNCCNKNISKNNI